MNNNKVALYSVSAFVLAVLAQAWIGNTDPQSETFDENKPDSAPVLAKQSDQSNVAVGKIQAKLTQVSEENEVWITEGMKKQMVDVAQAYEDNMRYPAYSTPLNVNDWSMLNPRAFVPHLVELEVAGLSAEIVLDHYIVHREKSLAVQVNIQGVENSDSAISHVSVSVGARNAIPLSSLSESEGVLTYSGILSAKEFSNYDDTEVPLSAVIQLESGEHTQISTAFKLASTEAVLTHMGASYVDGSDLAIPAYFDVSNPGFYRFRANLFDKDSGTPISHINASFMLSQHENEGLIKIHASTLRSKGFEGPYILKDFDITRGPASPGDKTGYGASDSLEFSVQGFDLNSYSREPYHDPKNQQRLEFLQKMAGIR